MAARNLLAAKILVGVGLSLIAAGLSLWVWGVVGMPWNEGFSEAIGWALLPVMLGSVLVVGERKVYSESKGRFRWISGVGLVFVLFTAFNIVWGHLVDGPVFDYCWLGRQLGLSGCMLMRPLQLLLLHHHAGAETQNA